MKKILILILTLSLLQFTVIPVSANKERDTLLLALAADTVAPDGSYTLRLAVCAMLINRQKSENYPKSLAAIICDAGISLPCAESASARSLRAAADALGGSDPTKGALTMSRTPLENKRARLAVEDCFFY